MKKKMKTAIRRYFPKTIQSWMRRQYYHSPFIRRLYHLPADIRHRLSSKKNTLPPPSKIFVGDGDFEHIGNEFFGYFTELAGLKPHENVLDVGSGIGRLAIPLTRYLSPPGSYDGLDIVEEGIEWCRKRIAEKFSHFHFHLADIHHPQYNPRGRLSVREFHFPYDDGRFDFVYLTSVFTHMLPEDVEHYLGEISRVMKPAGRCLITWFILNPDSLKYLEKGPTQFRYTWEQCRVIDPKLPEASIAFDEHRIRTWYERYGFQIRDEIQYGSWCGREQYRSYQDIVIAAKKSPG